MRFFGLRGRGVRLQDFRRTSDLCILGHSRIWKRQNKIMYLTLKWRKGLIWSFKGFPFRRGRMGGVAPPQWSPIRSKPVPSSNRSLGAKFRAWGTKIWHRRRSKFFLQIFSIFGHKKRTFVSMFWEKNCLQWRSFYTAFSLQHHCSFFSSINNWNMYMQG